MRSLRSRSRWVAWCLLAAASASGAAAIYLWLSARHGGASGRVPRLVDAIDGGMMEEFLEDPSDKEAILGWVREGAPRSGWARVGPIFEQRCVSCHYTDESRFMMLALDRYEPAVRATIVRPVLEEKITGGTMGKYLDSAREQSTMVRWVADGAPEAGFNDVKPILDEGCVHCHNPEGVAGIAWLDAPASTIRLARLPIGAPASGSTTNPLAVLLCGIASALGVLAAREFRAG